jgi:hypothetical protein
MFINTLIDYVYIYEVYYQIMVSKKIPISLTRGDFNYLNYIQQGSIYSGNPVSNMLTISDILKAVILHSTLNIVVDWEEHGSKALKEFLNACNITNPVLPKTREELILSIKEYITRERLQNILEQLKDEPSGLHDKADENNLKSFGELSGKDQLTEPGVTNFILALDENELAFFDLLKKIIEKYKKSTTSYSEMTRIFFRNLIINVDRTDTYKNINRFTFLGKIYVYGIYGFNAVETVLLLHGITDFFVKISKENLERLKIIYSDEVIFNIYLEEVERETKKNSSGNKKSLFSTDKKIDNPSIIDNISLSDLLDEKYRSAVSGFSFHSAYLGFHLLQSEWFFNQHKLPLLVAYFNGKNKDGLELSHILAPLSMRWFTTAFKDIYSLSKKYRDNPQKIY